MISKFDYYERSRYLSDKFYTSVKYQSYNNIQLSIYFFSSLLRMHDVVVFGVSAY